MSRPSAAAQLSEAQRALQVTENNCPHWDFEHESSEDFDCCRAAEEARGLLRAAQKRYAAEAQGKLAKRIAHFEERVKRIPDCRGALRQLQEEHKARGLKP